MNDSEKKAKKPGMPKSTVVLIILAVAIVAAGLSILAFLYAQFGSVDGFFQSVLQSSLEARYDRLVHDEGLWSWSIWIFFWGFVAVLVFVLLVVLYTTLLERKLIGWYQVRLGPNRVGPWGLLQPFADMVKLLIKEDIVPRHADKWLHLIAPLVIFIPTLLAFVAIPFGSGTVELEQKLVAPVFDRAWYTWIDPEEALEMDNVSGPGYLEAGVTIEESEEYHKTWWIPAELDHEPRFIPSDDDGYIIDPNPDDDLEYETLYRNTWPMVLPVKQENATQEPIYEVYFAITDYSTSGRAYDVIELDWGEPGDADTVIELALTGDIIDDVEEEYHEMIIGSDPDLPLAERFNFEGRSPQNYIRLLFNRFTDGVGINNRDFSAASISRAFGRFSGERTNWRDLYTPDWETACYMHGSVNREDEKASLMFFPAMTGEQDRTIDDYDLDTLDWREAGASFRIQRINATDDNPGGYIVETPDGQVMTELLAIGDSVQVQIGDEPVTVTLKDTQRYNIYIIGKDLGVGIIYILAVTSLGLLGIFMAGFGSNNKWSLYGAVRSVAQLMTYEVPMTLAVLGPIIMTGSLSTVDIVEGQRSTWYVLPQFLGFFVFLVCMVSEVNRSPFDLPEAESELVAGFHTEYSGLKFGFFFLAEYANMFLAGAVMTVLFFGGWKAPVLPGIGALDIPIVGSFVSSLFWFFIKSAFWLCVLIWFRATFPRFRIDQMMDYAWKILVPIALLNIIFTASMSYSDWNFTIWAQNNWRGYEEWIKPLFTGTYTKLYAVPIMTIIAILFATDYIALLKKKNGARS